MITAQIDWIDPNNFDSWQQFEEYEPNDPFDDYSWFTICVSEKGKEGGSNFQVLVSTPKAISRAKKKNEKFKGLVVDELPHLMWEKRAHGKSPFFHQGIPPKIV